MATRTQVTLTFIKMFALVLIIVPGVIALAKGLELRTVAQLGHYVHFAPTLLVLCHFLLLFVLLLCLSSSGYFLLLL